MIIEDEPQIRKFLRVGLGVENYRVVEAGNAAEGLAKAATESPDLILLDLNLPDRPGLALLREVRAWSAVPVIVLSVVSAEKDKIELLNAGADDYVTKPFGMGELLARIGVAWRHASPGASEEKLSCAGLEIDLAGHEARLNGQRLKLTPTEYSLLCLLARHAGKVVSSPQILQTVWGPGMSHETGYLRVYIAALRRKIEKNPNKPELILNEPGVGYRLNPDAAADA